VTKSLKVPSVLRAIGLPDALAQAAIILSLGKDNSDNDIDYVIETFSKIVGKLRGMSPAWDEFEKGAIDSLISPRQKHTITRD
jgi:cysteine desulfurase